MKYPLEYKAKFSIFVLTKLKEFFIALKPFYKERVATDNSLSYFNNHFDRFQLMIDICSKHVKSFENVCEVGSFYPYVSYYFKLFNGTKRIDLYDMILDELGNPCKPYNVDGVRLINFNLCKESLRATKRQYDLVICSEVIEHLPIDLSKFKRDLKGIVKEDGYLMITYPLGGHNAKDYNKLIADRDTDKLQEDHVREFTMETSNAFMKDVPMITSKTIRAKAYGNIRVCLYQL